ncbi:uncharacterized protein [Leptinotarsa decemlineata]|uniref:uncharacterized protein n=1 Tax=Leptinotarsa decemlineata TaxID=7539 RepID=UPI003D30922B
MHGLLGLSVPVSLMRPIVYIGVTFISETVNILSTMRTYKKKTNRGSTSEEDMEKALHKVIHNKESIRLVAKDLDTCHVILMRYVKKTNVSEAPIKFNSLDQRFPTFFHCRTP